MVALNNLCVDIVLPVESLPSPDIHERRRLLKDLTVSHPSRDVWEVGGSTNFLISAARLGMETASIGHVHCDDYGTFLEEVLLEEKVRRVQKVVVPEPDEQEGDPDDDDNLDSGTLLCFVLVDPEGGHAFCSRYDFGPWPLLPIEHLPDAAMQVCGRKKAHRDPFLFRLPRCSSLSPCPIPLSQRGRQCKRKCGEGKGDSAWGRSDGHRHLPMTTNTETPSSSASLGAPPSPCPIPAVQKEGGGGGGGGGGAKGTLRGGNQTSTDASR